MKAAEITLPVSGWVVQPSFRVKEVKLVEACQWLSAPEWFKTDTGKTVHASQFHATRGDAIQAAELVLQAQEEKLKTQTDNLAKRRTQLEKEKAAK